jgi:hypothetical protein
VGGGNWSHEIVQVIKVDALVKRFRIRKVDALIIDAEGFDHHLGEAM